jgi:sec-independent protein translocase protein TatA
MFGISFEHILIVGVVLLLFGPRRLPELGHTMGKAIKNFKDSINGVEEASYKRIQENKPANEASAPTANLAANPASAPAPEARS